MKDKGEIIVYQSENTLQLEVRMEDETVWLTQAQMIELFQRDQSVIARHIGNIFKEKELDEKRGCVKTKAHLLFYLKIVVPLFFVYATIFSVIR